MRQVGKNHPVQFPIFCAAAAPIAAVQLGWAIRTNADAQHVYRSLQAREPLFAWAVFDRPVILCVGGLIVGFLFVALLFSAPQTVRPRGAWLACGLWALALTGLNLWSGTVNVGGVADLKGVTWFRAEGVGPRRPWSEARLLTIGCQPPGKASAPRRLTYQVTFRDQSADLASQAYPERMASWLDRIDQIERQLPQGMSINRTDLDWRCLAAYSAALEPDDDLRLVRLMRPTRQAADSIAMQHPLWGEFVREAAAF